MKYLLIALFVLATGCSSDEGGSKGGTKNPGTPSAPVDQNPPAGGNNSNGGDTATYTATFSYPANNLQPGDGERNVAATAVVFCTSNGSSVSTSLCADQLATAPTQNQKSPAGQRDLIASALATIDGAISAVRNFVLGEAFTTVAVSDIICRIGRYSSDGTTCGYGAHFVDNNPGTSGSGPTVIFSNTDYAIIQYGSPTKTWELVAINTFQRTAITFPQAANSPKLLGSHGTKVYLLDSSTLFSYDLNTKSFDANGTNLLSASLYSAGITMLNGKTVFEGISSSTGRELFVHDPSTNTISIANDINPGVGNSEISKPMAYSNDKIFFFAKSGSAASSRRAYTYDTDLGTLQNVPTDFGDTEQAGGMLTIGIPKHATEYPLGRIPFVVYQNNMYQYAEFDVATELATKYGAIEFDQVPSVIGTISDGSILVTKPLFAQNTLALIHPTTHALTNIDVDPGQTVGPITPIARLDGDKFLLRAAYESGAKGFEPFVIDLTVAATPVITLLDINPGIGDSDPQPIATLEDYIVLNINDGVIGSEVALFDKTTYQVTKFDINPGPSSSAAFSLGVIGVNKMLVAASNGSPSGKYLYQLDGEDISSEMQSPSGNLAVSSKLAQGSKFILMSARSPATGLELLGFDLDSLDGIYGN